VHTVDEIRFAAERYVRRVAVAESRAWRAGEPNPDPPAPSEGEPDIFSSAARRTVSHAMDACTAAGERRMLRLLWRGLVAGALHRSATPALKAAAASAAAHAAFHGFADAPLGSARVPGPGGARQERSALLESWQTRLTAWRGSAGSFLAAAARLQEEAAALGLEDPATRLATLARADPEALVASARRFLDETEALQRASVEAACEANGLDPLPQHLPALFGVPEMEHRFTAARMLPVAGTVLLRLGIDVAAQRHLEVLADAARGPRPCRAFPLRLPDLAQVIVHRSAGIRQARLHLLELGHALHWLGTEPGPFPFRWPFGHRAVSDGYGLLLASLLTQPEVLHDRGLPAEVATALGRVCRRAELLHLRTMAALVVSDPVNAGQPEASYAEALGRARGVPVPDEEAAAWPLRVDRVYAAETYQSWLLMSSLVAALRLRVGPDWRFRRDTGQVWATWIATGQRFSVGELLARLDGRPQTECSLAPTALVDWLAGAIE